MIGVLDWGIGGLWAARRLLDRGAGPLLYLSDAGNRPYGLQPRRDLTRSVGRAVAALHARGASTVLVACHSASTVVDDLTPPMGVRVHGVIDGAVVPRVKGRTLVLGGARTVRSRAWRRALRHRDVTQRIAQPWSAAVERGQVAGEGARAMVRQTLRGAGPAAQIVLACTHYIALDAHIQAACPGVPRIDPALAIADRVAARTTDRTPDRSAAARAPDPSEAAITAWTTGDPDAIQRVVHRLFQDLPVRFMPLG